jgi:type VI secretion system protein ImpL
MTRVNLVVRINNFFSRIGAGRRVSRRRALIGLTIVCCTVGGLLAVSFIRNLALLDWTKNSVTDFARIIDPYGHEVTIGDRDLDKVLPLLYQLRNLPTGYATRKSPTPLLATFGLSQHERLQVSAEQVYHVGLERLFRPRLMFRLEEALDANKSNPGYIYEALKVYLMIAGVERTDRDLIISWMRSDWAENLYPGAPNADGRKALEAELVAMLDLQGGDEPLVDPNEALIAECRRILARLNIADRAYQLLKSQARQSIAPDWVAAEHGGADFKTVFDTASGDNVETILVPGFYTHDGFQRAFIDKLPTIAEQLQRDNWVLGNVGKLDAIQSQFDSLTRDVLNLYTLDFVAAWKQALDKLRIRPLNLGKPKYDALNAAAASNSPIRILIESIRDESTLTRERKDTKDGSEKKEAATPSLVGAQSGSPGASIEAQFKPFHQVVEGQHRLVDTIIGDLTAISVTLKTMNMNPDQAQQATNVLRIQVAQLKNDALQMPSPFSNMLLQSANSFENTVAN